MTNRKKLFKLTMLASRWNCYVVAILICVLLFYRSIVPLNEFLQRQLGLKEAFTILLISMMMIAAIYLLYLTMKHFLDNLFVKEEQIQAEAVCDVEELITNADLATYSAKRSGKNTVVMYAEEILNKPGKLTADEYEIMKSHVENSIGIIRHLPSLDYVIPAVLAHHERYDGHGYPRGVACGALY